MTLQFTFSWLFSPSVVKSTKTVFIGATSLKKIHIMSPKSYFENFDVEPSPFPNLLQRAPWRLCN